MGIFGGVVIVMPYLVPFLRLRAEHNFGKRDYRRELWTLLVLQLWLDSHKSSITDSNNGVTLRSPPGETCSDLFTANG